EEKKRRGERKLKGGEGRNKGMKSARVPKEGGARRQNTRHGRHQKAGGSLTVHHGLQALLARPLENRPDRLRMVVERRLVQGPMVGREIDASAPIFEPDVVSVLNEKIDQRRLDGRAEDVGPHARAM